MNISMQTNPLSCNLCPIIPTLIGWLNESFYIGPCSKYAEIEYDTVSLPLVDYDSVMRNAFFESDYFVQLEKSIKEKYSSLDFIIRWKEDEYYYLIFKNDSDLKEENHQLIDSITKDINDKITEMDRLQVFKNCHPMAIITSYERLKQDGRVMGIMRNNTRFDSFF